MPNDYATWRGLSVADLRPEPDEFFAGGTVASTGFVPRTRLLKT